MIDDKELFKILIEKCNRLTRRITKLITILFIIPILYFLLDNSLVNEISIPIIKFQHKDFLLSITPLLYSLIFLFASLLEAHKGRIIKSIDEVYKNEEINNPILYRYLIPFNINDEISSIEINNRFFRRLVRLFLMLPFYLFALLIPFSFWIYCLYYNFKYSGDLGKAPIIFASFSIWVAIASFLAHYYVEKIIYNFK